MLKFVCWGVLAVREGVDRTNLGLRPRDLQVVDVRKDFDMKVGPYSSSSAAVLAPLRGPLSFPSDADPRSSSPSAFSQ